MIAVVTGDSAGTDGGNAEDSGVVCDDVVVGFDAFSDGYLPNSKLWNRW